MKLLDIIRSSVPSSLPGLSRFRTEKTVYVNMVYSQHLLINLQMILLTLRNLLVFRKKESERLIQKLQHKQKSVYVVR